MDAFNHVPLEQRVFELLEVMLVYLEIATVGNDFLAGARHFEDEVHFLDVGLVDFVDYSCQLRVQLVEVAPGDGPREDDFPEAGRESDL